MGADKGSTPRDGSGFEAALAGGHMPALDGFRAVAALSVLGFHAGYGSFMDGVTSFFVLSGFLITTLLIRERADTGGTALGAFYTRRTLRIFPAYYAFAGASFALDCIFHNPWPPGLAAATAGYFVNYFNATHGHPSSSVAHLWSLGIEEQFYLLWPTLFMLLASRGTKTLRIGLTALIGLSVVWRVILHYGFGLGKAYLYNAFDARFDNLAIGCLLAAVVNHPKTLELAKQIGSRAWMPLVTLGLMFAVGQGLPSMPRHLYGFTIYSALVAILIVQLLELHQTRTWRWLDWPAVRFLGTLSYPIYLYHGWGLEAGNYVPAPRIVRFGVALVLTIVAASGSYYLVESPFLKLKKRFAVRSAPV